MLFLEFYKKCGGIWELSVDPIEKNHKAVRWGILVKDQVFMYILKNENTVRDQVNKKWIISFPKL